METTNSPTLDWISQKLEPIFERYGILKAILFGSFARKEETRRSDVDLMLIQETEKRFLDRYEGIFDEEPRGHSVQKLVSDFSKNEAFEVLVDALQKAAILDRFYIPTRYPHGLPDLTPGQSYFKADADQAIKVAQQFLELSRNFIAQ